MSETRTTTNHDDVQVPSARRRLPRSRGVGSGLAVLILGVWGALIPFVGPYFNFSYTPDKAWHWSAARGWLEVLPGAVAVLGGLLLLVSASRAATVLGAWLGIAAGAWFVIGLPLAPLLHIGSPGSPAGSHRSVTTLETLAMFYGLGALLIFFAATAFGRLSVVSQRDVHAAERRHESAVAEREAAERAAAEREVAERERVHRADLERDAADRSDVRRGSGTGASRFDDTAGTRTGMHEADTHSAGPTHAVGAQDPNMQQGPQQGYDPTATQQVPQQGTQQMPQQGYDPSVTPTERGTEPPRR